jgi:general nucleoside transport system permease protein
MTEPTPPATDPSAPDRPAQNETFMQHFLQGLWRANTFTVTALAIVLAMVIGGILIVISNPEVLSTYSYFLARPGEEVAVGG